MSADDLIQQMYALVNDYQRAKDPAMIFGEAAERLADELWRAVQPADPGQAIAGETERLDAARYALGWFHYQRYQRTIYRHRSCNDAEFTAAIVMLAPAADTGNAFPPALRPYIGPDATAKRQFTAAMALADKVVSGEGGPYLLDAVIYLVTRATGLPGSRKERERLWLLALACIRRYHRSGSPDDTGRAVQAAEQAKLIPGKGRSWRFRRRPRELLVLALIYSERYEQTGGRADLDLAIEHWTRAAAAFRRGHPLRARALAYLSHAYLGRFGKTGDIPDVDRAADCARQAVDIAAAKDPGRPWYLSCLGLCHRARFMRLGTVTDLDLAVSLCEQAADLAPAADARPAVLNALGMARATRFELTGLGSDLDRFIDVSEELAAACPADHPDRPLALSLLSEALCRRGQLRWDHDDLDRAIDTGTAAAADYPATGSRRAIVLFRLSSAYAARFDYRAPPGIPGAVEYLEALRSGGGPEDTSDLDRAVDYAEEAVSATGSAGRQWSAGRGFLAGRLLGRFATTRQVADVNRAADLARQALAATPTDDPDWPTMLSTLAEADRRCLEAGGAAVDAGELRSLVAGASGASVGTPGSEVAAAHETGLLAAAMGDWPAAVRLLDTAVRRLHLVPARLGGWADTERRVAKRSGLVIEAIAVHCAAGDPAGGVQIAELGRGILLGRQLDLQTDLTGLRAAHRDLADQYDHVRIQLAMAGGRAIEDGPAGGTQLWARHDELLARIRALAGFGGFMLPPPLADLRPAVAGGAAVLLNAAQGRGDAIVVTPDAAPLHVFLPDLTWAAAGQQLSTFLTGIYGSAAGVARSRQFTQTLAWLWEAAVGPVLQALRESDGGMPARVWWMGTAALSQFPLHAAAPAGEPGALDQVMSSYTATLRTLAHGRGRPVPEARRQFVVALSQTPGLADLPMAADEATRLRARQPGTAALLNADATADRVLAALPAATWAHFACHATIDPAAPSGSGLRLRDRVLPVSDIARLRITDGELAYLSGCSTADRGLLLADESLTLASAFQLAGFRHVVGSLWPLHDRIAATAADLFYDRVSDSPAAAGAAAAVHEVTRELRGRYPDRPDVWAALIHAGP